ncbi:nitroreductase family protein [Ideonella sp. DXS22W]|uniref:Nitroreductase family protein n=1 Tax=Pseudaquabacterium inlustre TaxID=2984192 RepID=A0ABU9CR07_9BURK
MSELADPVRAYHQRSKHALNRYAAGPDTLDWDAQPDPWRRWAGAPWQALPLLADDALPARWPGLHRPGAVPAQPLHVNSLSALLALAFGLAAWKTLGPDRWAVRCNPSSGNLHPTEAYVLARGVAGLGDGLWHYTPCEHGLEQRAAWPADAAQPPGLWLGLTSIHWREAWKYGERAFRYCQLDAGHALGAVRYAAALLGWQARVVPGLGHAQLAAWLGTDRAVDFGSAEAEEPELLLAIGPVDAAALGEPAGPCVPLSAWQGHANRLDRHPMYRWPVIDTVAQATRPVAEAGAPLAPMAAAMSAPVSAAIHAALPIADDISGPSAQQLIRQRRSAQRFDRQARIGASALAAIAQALHTDPQRSGLPWDVLGHAAPQVHPVFFAHRVDGLAPGAYVLPRSAAGEALLRAVLPATLDWRPVDLIASPGGPPARLWQLVENPALAGTLRTLNCHQALGSDAAVAVAMLGAFDAPLTERPDAYRQLLREAGLLGQVLYLQAEALGLRGTGIGCYFDDAVHQLLGLADGDTRLQSLYHFTLGLPVADARIATDPPYAHLHVNGEGQPGQPARPVLGPEDFR